MMPNLQLGPFSLPTPALIIVLGLWLGISVSERYAARNTMNSNHLSNLILIVIISGILGARLAYIARYPSAFAENPIDILSRNIGLFDSPGGIVIGVTAAVIYGQRKGMPFWSTLDSLTPALSVLGVALALSHLASGSAFGKPTNLPWGLELWGARRHPTQIYEIILAGIILLLVLKGSGNIFMNRAGSLFLCFIAMTAFSRLILETYRGDSILFASGLRRDQILAWLFLATSLWGLGKIWSTKNDLKQVE